MIKFSFEQAGSVADHAPSLLAAYEILLSYPDLDRVQQRFIKANIAQVLFDWGYRCRQHQQWREAGRLHWRSLRFGKRRENTLTLCKLI